MKQPVQILLVEDNEGDVILAKEALKESELLNEISVAKDGQEAMDFLYKRGKFIDACTPDLVLLDINLPRIDGMEVLHLIKHDDRLRTIPVVMLTTSSSESDIQSSYYNYANCYITKPVDLEKFLTIVHKIENFWMSVVRLPSKT
jgi:two-component system, chemotaxis family, response regulator Rcp1